MHFSEWNVTKNAKRCTKNAIKEFLCTFCMGKCIFCSKVFAR